MFLKLRPLKLMFIKLRPLKLMFLKFRPLKCGLPKLKAPERAGERRGTTWEKIPARAG